MASEDSHNAKVLKGLKIGDLVEFPRAVYSHWGVYIGNQEIAHLTGIRDRGSSDTFDKKSLFCICGDYFPNACVKIEDFFKVAKGCKARRNNDKDAKCTPLSPNEIVERAKEKVGKISYNLIWHNCEHFAAYLRYGVKWSEQVNNAAMAVLGVCTALGAGAMICNAAKGSDKKNESAN